MLYCSVPRIDVRHLCCSCCPACCCRWALPSGGCSDLSDNFAGNRLVVVCGSFLYGMTPGSGAVTLLLPAACSAAFDTGGTLWVARSAVSEPACCCCVGCLWGALRRGGEGWGMLGGSERAKAVGNPLTQPSMRLQRRQGRFLEWMFKYVPTGAMSAPFPFPFLHWRCAGWSVFRHQLRQASSLGCTHERRRGRVCCRSSSQASPAVAWAHKVLAGLWLPGCCLLSSEDPLATYPG